MSDPIHTPGVLYVLRQRFPDLEWQVVAVPWDQGERLRNRGEAVYDTAAQAQIVRRRLAA